MPSSVRTRLFGIALTALLLGPNISFAQSDKSTLSRAAKWLVNNRIKEACQGNSGNFDNRGIVVVDLDGDSKNDLILHDEWIACKGGISRSASCGNVACEINIYLRRRGLLEQYSRFMGVGLELDTQSPPTIKTQGFRLQDVYTRWTGDRFENVSPTSFRKENSANSLTEFFNSRECMASENDLYDFFLKGSGGAISLANRQVVETVNREDIQVISSDPYIYRFTGSSYCQTVEVGVTSYNQETTVEGTYALQAQLGFALLSGAVHLTRECFKNSNCRKKAFDLATASGVSMQISNSADIPETDDEDDEFSKSNPPGDCDHGKHRRLQDDVNKFCHTERSCKATDEIDILFRKWETNRLCAVARTKINNSCFRGGDKNHRDQADDAYRAMARCESLIEK